MRPAPVLAFVLAWCLSAPLHAQAPSQCELHVWAGGYPQRKARSSPFIKVVPPRCDATDRLCPSYFYSPTIRTRAFPDTELIQLFPPNATVTVIRHSDVIDLDRIKLAKSKVRLSSSLTGCYADLLLINLYGIFPNPNQVGVAEGLIAGGNRLVLDLQLRSELTTGAKPILVARRNDAPVASFRSDPAVYAGSVASASNEVLRAFVLSARKQLGFDK